MYLVQVLVDGCLLSLLRDTIYETDNELKHMAKQSQLTFKSGSRSVTKKTKYHKRNLPFVDEGYEILN